MSRGRQNPSGFTLIELLIVVVIIGVLAAVAIPKFASSKGKAYTATLKADLRNLATAQEAYFYENTTYTMNLGQVNFTPSQGVIVNMVEGTGQGWSATAANPNVTPTTCAIYFGQAAPVAPAVTEGVVGCQ